MNAPNHIIPISERTKSGSLKTKDLQLVSHYLLCYSFVLLPSDTCYSIAAAANSIEVFGRVNKLLNRNNEPISLSFQNIRRIEEYIQMNMVSAHLLENFTPGPITIICKANSTLRDDVYRKALGSNNNTIGVRIPDSIIEREVSSCTVYPITSAAVRKPSTKEIVQDFDQAVEIVLSGMSKMGSAGLIAIEGGTFYSKHSTVVKITDDINKISLIREGDIPFNDIQSSINAPPYSQWAIDDWL